MEKPWWSQRAYKIRQQARCDWSWFANSALDTQAYHTPPIFADILAMWNQTFEKLYIWKP